MSTRIIFDFRTSLKEILDWVNSSQTEEQKHNRFAEACQRIPEFLHICFIYFRKRSPNFTFVAEQIESLKYTDFGMHPSSYFSFQKFVNECNEYTDKGFHESVRLSKLNQLLEWVIPADRAIILKMIKLEEVDEFTDLGLDVFEKYYHNKLSESAVMEYIRRGLIEEI